MKSGRGSPPEPCAQWRLPSWAASAAVLLWWAGISWIYYRRPESAPRWALWPSLLPDVFSATGEALGRAAKLSALLAGLIFLGWMLGQAALSALRLEPRGRLEALCVGTGLGWGLLATGMFLLGLSGLWNAPAVAAFIAAALAGAAFFRVRLGGNVLARRPSISPDPWARATAARWGAWEVVFAGILAAAAAFNFLGALMPEIFYDALVYHLALPELYWLRGGIAAAPENLYSGLPMLVQMLYALAFPLGGDALAHLVHWSFGAGSALLAYAFAGRFSGRRAGLLAALLFYAIPTAGVLSWKGAVELGWAFFELLALYSLARRLESGPPEKGWTLLAGLAAGFAMASKYQAWPLLPVLCFAFFAAQPGALSWKERGKETALFAAAALAALLPWILKNAAFYGNPVYPFLHERFASGPPPRWRELLADGGGLDPVSLFSSWKGVRAYLLHPWSLTLGNNDINSIGPAFLLGLPLLFLCRYPAPGLRMAWLASLSLWGLWSLSSTLSRFLLPHLLPICVLFASAIEDLLGGRIKALCLGAILLLSCGNLFWLSSWLKTYGAAGVILGTQAREDYLKRPHPSYARPPYPALEFVNERLGAGARILFVGEARGFQCRRDRICSTRFDDYPLLAWLRQSRALSAAGPGAPGTAQARSLLRAAALRDRFRENGLTHVLVNLNELAAWQGGARPFLPWSPEDEKLWEDFKSLWLRPVFEFRGPPSDDFSSAWIIVYEVGK